VIKQILIPIDFNIESLNTLKLALEECKLQRVNILLIYAETLTNAITELVFYSNRKKIMALSSSQFNDALNILKNTYESSIQSIDIKLFHGFNKQAFINFCQANQVDVIYIPKYYQLAQKKNSFDPIPLIKKSNIPFIEVSWNSDSQTLSDDEINQLFK
jgi:hypothetical protein